MNPNETSPTVETKPSGTAGLVLGIISMILWILPILGLPLSICGLVVSIKAQNKGASGKATAGIILCIIALVLTIINAAIGAYLGATGQHPVVNTLTQ